MAVHWKPCLTIPLRRLSSSSDVQALLTRRPVVCFVDGASGGGDELLASASVSSVVFWELTRMLIVLDEDGVNGSPARWALMACWILLVPEVQTRYRSFKSTAVRFWKEKDASSNIDFHFPKPCFPTP